MRSIRAAGIGATVLLAAAVAGLNLEGFSRARRLPTPATRSRANDTPVLDHVPGGGPYGGHVTSLAVARTVPATAYVSLMPGGVYRSTDRGETWQPADRGLPARSGCDLLADPVDGGTLYAACYEDGFFKTIDGGRLWRQLDLDHPYAPVIAAADPDVLYDSGLRSRDGGRRWSRVAPQEPPCHPGRFVIDPGDAETLACITESGLMTSRDGGRRWTAVPGPAGVALSSLLAVPGAPDRLLAATDAGALYAITNRGATWTLLGQVPGGVDGLIADDSGRVLHARQDDGLVRSEDGGRTWHALPLHRSLVGLSTYAVDPGDPLVLYVGTWEGPYVSLDGGQTWRLATRGLTRAAATVAVHEGPRSTVLAAVGAELLESGDGGTTWSAVSGRGLPDTAEERFLAADGDGGVRLRAGARSFRLVAGGTEWVEEDAAAESAPGVMQLATLPAGVTPTAVVPVGSDPRHLVAGIGGLKALVGGSRSSLWRSRDGGATWTLTRTGTEGPTVQCCALLRDPNDADTLFAVETGMVIGGGGARLLRSVDAGVTWTDVGWFQDVVSLVPTRPSTLLGQPYRGGLTRSTDGGTTWTPAHSGLPPGIAVTDVAFDRRRPATIFAATAGRGIYRSEDAGVSWTPAGYATTTEPAPVPRARE